MEDKNQMNYRNQFAGYYPKADPSRYKVTMKLNHNQQFVQVMNSDGKSGSSHFIPINNQPRIQLSNQGFRYHGNGNSVLMRKNEVSQNHRSIATDGEAQPSRRITNKSEEFNTQINTLGTAAMTLACIPSRSSIGLHIRPNKGEDNSNESIFPLSMISNKSSDSTESKLINDCDEIENGTDGEIKSFPRLKHFFKKIEEEKKQINSICSYDTENSRTTNLINFEQISAKYPPSNESSENKRLCSVISSSSESSSPETIPSITDESTEKEYKRPKTTRDENQVFANMDILCQAVNLAESKQKQQREIQHSIIIKSLDKSKICSCPRSRCIKLYCECFSEGRLCSSSCSCKTCKNTQEETGPHGLRTKAINGILSRNPHAFSKKAATPIAPLDYDGIMCRCVKSQCLKLYCDCFQASQVCSPACKCINCLNTNEESGSNGKRTAAQHSCIQRNPDAFKPKVKKDGSSCSCRNNRYVSLTNCFQDS